MAGSFLRRLPYLAVLFVAIVLGVFVWMAFVEVERTLIAQHQTELRASAGQVANLLSQLASQRVDEVRGNAAAITVPEPGADNAETRAQLQARLGSPTMQTVELWRSDGSLAAAVQSAAPDRTQIPIGSAVPSIGILPLGIAGPFVYSGLAVDVPGGVIAIRRVLQISPVDIFTRMTGGAHVAVGNAADATWTDFSKIVPPPNLNDTTQLAVIVPVPNTPWAVAVERPRAPLVALAYAFATRMAAIGLTFFALAAVAIIASYTVLKRAERHAQEDLDRFFSLSLDLLCIAAPDGRFRRVNPAWKQTLGWDTTDLTSAPFEDFVHPDDLPATRAEAARLFSGPSGTLAVDFENRYRRKDGEYRWLSWKVVRGDDGSLYAVARDVTDMKEANQALQRADAAKNTFLSSMSHDLRTPLNSILGFAQLLRMSDLDAERRQFVDLIISGGRHLLQLINEVLDISRIESGQLALSVEPVALKPEIDELVSQLQPIAGPFGVKIEVGAIPRSITAVKADRHRLRQILLNLASNAVKYNHQGGRVMIEARAIEGDRVRIAVSDTGPGIPADKHPLRLRPVGRLVAEGASIEGTGLGLAIADGLARAMGGSLGFESRVGAGSTFWVDLEAAQLAVADPAAVARTSDEGTVRQGLIVYIEDNQSNVVLMQSVLASRPGLKLLRAATGAEGLALIQRTKPDLVLLDLHLPDMNGEEVLRRLRRTAGFADLPVIVVTADATAAAENRLRAAGATAHLTKPLDIRHLMSTIDAQLRPVLHPHS